MLDLTGRPAPRVPATPVHGLATASAVSATTASQPTLADLHAHVSARTNLSTSVRTRYLGAITEAARILNKPLAGIAADLKLVEERFTLTGFDPAHWPTNAAYQTFRRRLQAPLREFLGLHAAQAALRAQQDDWTRLFAAVEPLTEGKVGAGNAWHPMKLAALRTFALVARAYAWQPRDLTFSAARQIDADFRGNKRDANYRALRSLDKLRAFPQLLPLLPPRPIGFSAPHRTPVLAPLDPKWEDQFLPWIDALTKSRWDPVDEVFTANHVGHAHVMRAAFRTALRIGLDIGAIDPASTDLTHVLADDETLCAIAREMFARSTRSKKDGRLTPRTSRKYLKALNQVRGHLGIDTTLIAQVLANNAVARKGRKADKCMTPKNQAFCEALLNKRPVRQRFLLSFRTLREAAEAILQFAALEGRALTGHERAQVRMLGTSACFAALEIGGAPIRVGNAMALTCLGEDAQIRIPPEGTKPIQVLIPAELTKNKAEIRFPIKANKFGCHDTIRWYMITIRPLFPHADTSPYLFPAVATPWAPLNPDYFGAMFAGLMRTVVDLPMTPHQMRHGQTSLLLDKYPHEVDVIAKRIDDKPATLRQFYGFVNSLKLVERGQDLLVGIMEE